MGQTRPSSLRDLPVLTRLRHRPSTGAPGCEGCPQQEKRIPVTANTSRNERDLLGFHYRSAMVALHHRREFAMSKFVNTLTVLALAVTTFAVSPASARILSNGLAVKGTESGGTQRVAGPTLARIINNGRVVIGAEGNSEDTTLDSQALRVIGIEFPR
jgi:hypothetical protein